MRCLTLGSFLLLGGLVGCDVNVTVDGKQGDAAPAESSAEDGGTSIQIPGLGVDIKGKDGKWDVKAPGTDVKVDGGKVDVEAPGTKVNTDLSTGKTKVEAPGTSVDVE